MTVGIWQEQAGTPHQPQDAPPELGAALSSRAQAIAKKPHPETGLSTLCLGYTYLPIMGNERRYVSYPQTPASATKSDIFMCHET